MASSGGPSDGQALGRSGRASTTFPTSSRELRPVLAEAVEHRPDVADGCGGDRRARRCSGARPGPPGRTSPRRSRPPRRRSHRAHGRPDQRRAPAGGRPAAPPSVPPATATSSARRASDQMASRASPASSSSRELKHGRVVGDALGVGELELVDPQLERRPACRGCRDRSSPGGRGAGWWSRPAPAGRAASSRRGRSRRGPGRRAPTPGATRRRRSRGDAGVGRDGSGGLRSRPILRSRRPFPVTPGDWPSPRRPGRRWSPRRRRCPRGRQPYAGLWSWPQPAGRRGR